MSRSTELLNLIESARSDLGLPEATKIFTKSELDKFVKDLNDILDKKITSQEQYDTFMAKVVKVANQDAADGLDEFVVGAKSADKLHYQQSLSAHAREVCGHQLDILRIAKEL